MGACINRKQASYGQKGAYRCMLHREMLECPHGSCQCCRAPHGHITTALPYFTNVQQCRGLYRTCPVPRPSSAQSHPHHKQASRPFVQSGRAVHAVHPASASMDLTFVKWLCCACCLAAVGYPFLQHSSMHRAAAIPTAFSTACYHTH